MEEEFSYALDPLESSECSSIDASDEQNDAAQPLDLHDSLALSKPDCLSSLYFFNLSSGKALEEVPQVKQSSTVCNDSINPCYGETFIRKNDASCAELVELSRPCISEILYADEVPPLGWPVGGLDGNPLNIDQSYRDDRFSRFSDSDEYMNIPHISKQPTTECMLMHNVRQGHDSSSSYLIQSWNARYSSNVLSMNPMLTRNAFIHDVNEPRDNSSKISNSLPCFDFSSATDPLKIYESRSIVDQGHHLEHEHLASTNIETSPVGNMDGCGRTVKGDDVRSDKDHLDHRAASLNSKRNTDVCPEHACGGSGWQVLLRGSHRVDNGTNREHEHEHGKGAMFEMPLDFIIDKGLMQEIMLQYPL